MSFLELLAKPSSRTLLDILTKLPKCGIGSRVTRKSWETYGNSYWEVTHVKPLTSDGTVGEVGISSSIAAPACLVLSTNFATAG